MITKQQLDDLVELVRERFPGWDGFDHPPFVEDETAYKQASAAKAAELLSEVELDRLLLAGEYDEIINRLEAVGRDSNLLWQSAPSRGDLAILYDGRLDPREFGYVVRKLLYGRSPSPERLGAFSDYAARLGLPNKWTFPTYFLFLVHPETEYFVKPSVARWFLKFMGRPDVYDSRPNAATYAILLEEVDLLADLLQAYRPDDMIDIQSFIWVARRVSDKRVGALDVKGQVELDVPAAIPDEMAYDAESETAVLREGAEADQYSAMAETPPAIAPAYSLSRAAEETGFDEDDLARWVRAIERKGQAIFYGPPGTGKTFLAQKLAQHLIGGGDGFVELVQFHAAYAYEEFIEGIRPQTEDGRLTYDWVDGRFLQFCQQAARRNGRCVLIVDEINRANLARVFGELMILLEYRNQEIPLASGRRFRIPANVRLIGTMNTADRSIALVDHALRRRFASIALLPNYDLLRRYHARRQTGFDVEPLVGLLQDLNHRIDDPHYHVGVTFFLRPDLAEQLPDIWQMEIEPYLEEFFFDQPAQVDAFRWTAVGGRFE